MRIDRAEVVFGGAEHAEPAGRNLRRGPPCGRVPAGFLRCFGTGMVALPERYCAVSECSTCRISSSVPCGDEMAAAHAGARAEIDDVIGRADGVFVVLHHDHGIAQIAQPAQRGDEPVIVALMQADARLIEHVEAAGEAGADLRGEPDALRFAAGKRAALAVEREIAEADLHEEIEAIQHLAAHLRGDESLLLREVERRQELLRLAMVSWQYEWIFAASRAVSLRRSPPGSPAAAGRLRRRRRYAGS